MAYKNLWSQEKKEKSSVINAYIKKWEWYQTSNLTWQLKELEKEEKTKLKSAEGRK